MTYLALVQGVGIIFVRKQRQRLFRGVQVFWGLRKLENAGEVGLEYAGTFVGAVVLLIFMGIVAASAFGIASLGSMSAPIFTLLTFVVTMSAIQVFGTDVLEALAEYRGGGDTTDVVIQKDGEEVNVERGEDRVEVSD